MDNCQDLVQKIIGVRASTLLASNGSIIGHVEGRPQKQDLIVSIFTSFAVQLLLIAHDSYGLSHRLSHNNILAMGNGTAVRGAWRSRITDRVTVVFLLPLRDV
uniref:OSJNBa0004B13.6 protein n=1 Tax=Oryza sativa subsp. japonica TaxID=39947 RepID=Q9ARZ2_ORYSJ|nr:OSJNBa0004B13.6 [Oryza sativa Japonica Group]